MTNTNEIHRSLVEPDDLEEIYDEGIPIGEVFLNLLRHPGQIITRWNWKAALLGALLRASFYFTVYKASKETWIVTLTAVIVELAFRFITSGISGSLVQSFRRATPPWLATLIVSITLPVFSHAVEYVSHYAQENYFDSIFAASVNNSRQKAFAISVLMSILAALFNLYVMQRGVLLVGAGEETQSFRTDLKMIPALVIEFIAFLPKRILNFIGEKKFLSALGVFLSFGFTLGAIMGVFRGKWLWAWSFAVGAWITLFFTTIIVAVTLPVIRRRREEGVIED